MGVWVARHQGQSLWGAGGLRVGLPRGEQSHMSVCVCLCVCWGLHQAGAEGVPWSFLHLLLAHHCQGKPLQGNMGLGRKLGVQPCSDPHFFTLCESSQG